MRIIPVVIGLCLAAGLAWAQSFSSGSNAPPNSEAPLAPGTAVATKSAIVGCQYNSTLNVFTNGQQGQVSCGPSGELLVNLLSQYPYGATPITGNSTGTTGAVVGTLAGVSAKTTYICGFDVSGVGGTAAIGPITVAGTKTSSMVYQLFSTAAGVTLSRSFSPCVPANAANTAITITTTADGTATAVDVNSWGYQL